VDPVHHVKGEHRLRAFDSWVLREILEMRGARKQGDGKKVPYDELHNLNCPQNIVRVIKSTKIRWVEHVARMGKERNECMAVVWKDEGKRHIERPWLRWEDNIKMCSEE